MSYQTNEHGLPRKEPIVEQRQDRRKRDGSHQCQHVGALLGGFAWARERHGDDRGSAYSCNSLDKTTGYPSRDQFAHADAPPEPPPAGKNGDHEEDERGNRNRHQGRIGRNQSPSSDRRRDECRNAHWQDDGSLGSPDGLWQQLEHSRQPHHVVDRDGGMWAKHQAEHRYRDQRCAEANEATQQASDRHRDKNYNEASIDRHSQQL